MEALTKEDFIEPEQQSENKAETKYNEANLLISGILSKTEQEKAQLEEAQMEEAQPKEAKQEEAQMEEAKKEEAKRKEAQLEKAKQEEAKKEEAKRKEAKKEEAQLEEAKRQKDEEEKAKQEKAKQEKAKKENTISSISNYFMKDNVDNIEKRFRKFIKEHGTDKGLKFTDNEFGQIDKAVIKRAIKNLSDSPSATSPQQTAPKISIRTTNALIEVLGRTIKKEKNVKELFDLNNIKINSDEVDRIFNKYFKHGLKEKEIRKYINLESKDNDSENVEFIVNRIAGISENDLIELFENNELPLNENEIKKLREKYFKDGKINMEKLIELYGIK